MKWFWAIALAASLLGQHASASPAANPNLHGNVRLKEFVNHPRGWVKRSSAPPDYILDLRIALPQPNFDMLEKHLYEVSDPDHPRYGQHLSKQEVEALVAPHQESVDAVDAWLASHGLNVDDLIRSPARDWVKVYVPVSLAEEMLNTVSLREYSESLC